MVDFEKARLVAFESLSKGNSVSKVSEEDKKLLHFLSDETAASCDVLLVQTEYLNPEGVAEDISFYLVLRPDFPLTLPKIYLSRIDYGKLKYIPHVDVNAFICTYDTDTTRTNPENPGGIVQACLSRAIKIVENGVSKTNESDFEEEFKAYWENQYDDEPDLKQDILALLDDPAVIAEISFIKLSKNISNYNHVIYQDDETGRRFIEYLKYRNISFKNESICYLGQLNITSTPPLNLNNEKVDKIVSALSQSQQNLFRKYINSIDTPKFILGYTIIDGRPFYLGWIHGPFNLKRKGFRKSILNNHYVFRNLQRKDKLIRVSPQLYTPTQSILRTDGINQPRLSRHKFLITGLGSIGSNLLFFLNGINNPEMRLIDYDKLTIDNLNRHFLGINYLGLYKAVALRNHYMMKNPFQVITCKNESFIATCQTDVNYVNDADFIFCATGKANIDQWVGHALKEGIITKPIFFFWVEPYLVGGHCLYLTPGGKHYDEFFDSNNFFKNNIIDNDEYLLGNTKLSLREGGCQISYTPYSLNNVTAFLSAIFPKIRDIIENPLPNSVCISWVGNMEPLQDLKIKASQLAKDNMQDSLIIAE